MTRSERARLTFAVAALIVASPAFADEATELAAGKILVSSVPVAGSSEPQRVVRAVVESPPSSVWKVVSECAHYRERMPHIAASAELARSGSTVTCQVTVAMPFPVSNLTGITEAVHVERPDGMSRTWHLVSGDYEYNDGSWTVEPYRAGAASLVTYRLHVKPKTAVPGFIRNMAQEKTLPELMQRVRLESAKM